MESNVKALKMEQVEKVKATEYRLFKYVFAGMTFLLTIFSVIGANAQAADGKIFNNTNAEGVILDGYDAVAFFTDNKPVKGDMVILNSMNDAKATFGHDTNKVTIIKNDFSQVSYSLKSKKDVATDIADAIAAMLTKKLSINGNTYAIPRKKFTISTSFYKVWHTLKQSISSEK